MLILFDDIGQEHYNMGIFITFLKDEKGKQMIKILLVEDDVKVCDAFAIAIQSNPKFTIVGMTGKQTEAMNLLLTMDIDAMVLDLELEEGDGIHLLDEMNLKLEKLPALVSFTNIASERTLQYIREKGVDFVYAKNNPAYTPPMILDIFERITPYCKRKTAATMHVLAADYNLKKEIEYQFSYVEHELEKMGFKPKKQGTVLLAEAICIKMNAKPNQVMQVTNDIYPVIAANRNTTSANIEKNIRGAIERVWKQTNIATLERFYPFQWDSESGRPTNTDFIFNMAQKLKE